jgi:hypothetical protein
LKAAEVKKIIEKKEEMAQSQTSGLAKPAMTNIYDNTAFFNRETIE